MKRKSVKRHFLLKIAALLTLGAVAAVQLSGCGWFGGNPSAKSETPAAMKSFDEQQAINLTVILGDTRYAVKPDVSILKPYFERLSTYGGRFTYIVDDGSPDKNFKTIPVDAPDKSKTNAAQERTIDKHISQLGQVVTAMTAKTPETNVLASLDIACKNTPRSEDCKNVLIVFDNGIQTSGTFIMRDLSVISMRTDSIISQLEQGKNIPNFSKFDVIRWYGLGQTDNPDADPENEESGQKAPANTDMAALKDYYSVLLQKGGYTDTDAVFMEDTLSSGNTEERKALPFVTTVKVSDPSVHIEPIDALPEEETSGFIPENPIIEIREDLVAFEPNSAIIKDTELAKQSLRKVIEMMQKYDGEIVIIGCTATLGATEGAIDLSRQRAQAFKDLLTAEGIDGERIGVYGSGFSDRNLTTPADVDENGNLIESIAATNRKVVIMSKTHDYAKKYLDGTFKP